MINSQRQRAEETSWGRDPFEYVEEEQVQGDRTNILELKGISVAKDKTALAFVNDEIVKVGDNIGGYTILRIENDKVLLQKGNQNFYLTLSQE